MYFVIFIFLQAIALPYFIRPRTFPSVNACISNLKQIDGAVQQWALENRKTAKDSVTLKDAAGFLKGGVLPICPDGGTYYVSTVGSSPACSLMFRGDLNHDHSLKYHTESTWDAPEKDYRELDPALQKILAGEYERWKQMSEQQRQLAAHERNHEKAQREQWQRWKPAVIPVIVLGVLIFGLYLVRLRRCLREFRSQSTA